jgi:hypothetical protein
MSAVAKIAAQITHGKTNEDLPGTHVKSFALNSGKEFN